MSTGVKNIKVVKAVDSEGTKVTNESTLKAMKAVSDLLHTIEPALIELFEKNAVELPYISMCTGSTKRVGLVMCPDVGKVGKLLNVLLNHIEAENAEWARDHPHGDSLKRFRHVMALLVPPVRRDGDPLPLGEIDEEMRPLIVELNKLGLKTLSCCAGHPESGSPHAYVLFSCEGLDHVSADFDHGIPTVSFHWTRPEYRD